MKLAPLVYSNGFYFYFHKTFVMPDMIGRDNTPFYINFEQISYNFLVFPLLTFSK